MVGSVVVAATDPRHPPPSSAAAGRTSLGRDGSRAPGGWTSGRSRTARACRGGRADPIRDSRYLKTGPAPRRSVAGDAPGRPRPRPRGPIPAGDGQLRRRAQAARHRDHGRVSFGCGDPGARSREGRTCRRCEPTWGPRTARGAKRRRDVDVEEVEREPRSWHRGHSAGGPVPVRRARPGNGGAARRSRGSR